MLYPLKELGRLALKCLSKRINSFFKTVVILADIISGNSLNSSYACCHTALRQDLKLADNSRIRDMSSTAEFLRVVAHHNNSYLIAVFLTKESHSAGLLSFLNRHDLRNNRKILTYLLIYDILNLLYLVRCHRLEVAEVKPRSVSVLIGACLLYMSSEYIPQRFLKQMGSAVVAAGSKSRLFVNLKSNLLAIGKHSLSNSSYMSDLAARYMHCTLYLK